MNRPTARIDRADMVSLIANNLLNRGAEHVLMGPVVHDHQARFYFWYCLVTAKPEFTVERLQGKDKTTTAGLRADLIAAILQHRPDALKVFDDELKMAEFAAAICPCEETNRHVAYIRLERATAHGTA
jgi:hypothetical protein